eukprot:CAMPEP_0170494144 /NCGR_PEP_ID=MMETSP0208-20121228/14474_1 /TAXON_ID=197538 /ORGANISM="Strombidium inclinatum, Strain S3" /LENGTH=164 /DNA_ID=CAMNT_0010770155 /DNA_START=376 /DNA_END=870 /DNA_ORIENTATION=+
MGGLLSTEVPSLHGSLETLTLADGLHVHELSDLEVEGSHEEADGQEALRRNGELSQVLLGRDAVLQEMANLGLSQLLEVGLAATDLDGVDTVLLHGLNLGNLAAIHLEDSAHHHLAPTVPVMSATHLVGEEAGTLRKAVDGLGFNQIAEVLLVDGIAEVGEALI